MCRAVFLRLVSLGVLLFTLWRQITCMGDLNSLECEVCQYNHEVYPVIIYYSLILKDASPSQTSPSASTNSFRKNRKGLSKHKSAVRR